MTKKQDELAKLYAQLAKKLSKYPTRADLIKAGMTWDAVRGAFGGMEGIKAKSRDAYPNHFDDIVDPDYFNREVFDELRAKVKKYKRFFITTAVAGAPIDEDALAAIDAWAKAEKGLPLFLAANYALYDLPADFVAERDIVFRDLKLNSNITISTIKIDPKQVDPILGLDCIGQREGTTIIGSPKQRMKPIANSNTRLAHVLQATGAVTRPRYVPRTGIALRRDTLATKQHVMGGIIVEIEDDKYYHFRQVQFKEGGFCDTFHRYDADGKTFVGCEAIVQGDYHDGETDPTADACADELCKIGKPKYRVFHDFNNGHSISHHDRSKKVLQAIKAKAGKLSLATELHNACLTIKRKLALNTAEKLVFVKSNHDEFLERYLEEGVFDDHNRLLSTELQLAMMQGKDPLQHAFAAMGLKPEGRIVWLDRDQDMRISKGKIEVGCHGDLGAGGKRNPGNMGMAKAYGDCVYGHCHFPEIGSTGAWSVGTTSYLKLQYNRGPSAWMHSHIIIYANGSRQIINSIGGKWRLRD